MSAKSIKDPRVSVIIPILNEERYLAACLEALMASNYPKDRLEVIAVDNGSTDNSVNIAKRFQIVVLLKENVKVGAVRNYGASKATGDILVFLDSDCLVSPDWIFKGVNRVSSLPDLVLGGVYSLREKSSWVERDWVLEGDQNHKRENFLCGGCIFISKKHFDLVEGFDEDLNAGEDTDLTEKLRGLGKQVVISSDLSVIHLGYPRVLSEFIRRQKWHSSDVVANFPKSLRNPIFLITLLFNLGIFLMVLGAVIDKIWLFFTAFVLLFFCPSILSFKRILRSGIRVDIFRFFKILTLDFMYLIGRSQGFYRGIVMLLHGDKKRKVRR